jgi:very-short-patch-repair endonuclease
MIKRFKYGIARRYFTSLNNIEINRKIYLNEIDQIQINDNIIQNMEVNIKENPLIGFALFNSSKNNITNDKKTQALIYLMNEYNTNNISVKAMLDNLWDSALNIISSNKDLSAILLKTLPKVQNKNARMFASIYHSIFSKLAKSINPNTLLYKHFIKLDPLEINVSPVDNNRVNNLQLETAWNSMMSILKNDPFFFQNEDEFLLDMMVMYESTFYKVINERSSETTEYLTNLDSQVSKIFQKKNISHYTFLLYSLNKLGNKHIKIYPATHIMIPRYVMMIKDLLDDKHSGLLYNYFFFVRSHYNKLVPQKNILMTILSSLAFINKHTTDRPINKTMAMQLLYAYSKISMTPNITILKVCEEYYVKNYKNVPLQELTVYITSIVLVEAVSDRMIEIFKELLHNLPKSNEKVKVILNIALYLSLAKLDDLEKWDAFFNHMQKYTKDFNNFDRRMYLETIEYLKLIDERYEVLSKYVNFKFTESNQAHTKWYFTTTDGTGAHEHIIEKSLNKLNIQYRTQIAIKDILTVDFLLGDNVVLNINGIQHYHTDNVFKETLKNRRRDEVLKKLGYHVLNLNLMFERKIHHAEFSTSSLNDFLNKNLSQPLLKTIFKAKH